MRVSTAIIALCCVSQVARAQEVPATAPQSSSTPAVAPASGQPVQLPPVVVTQQPAPAKPPKAKVFQWVKTTTAASASTKTAPTSPTVTNSNDITPIANAASGGIIVPKTSSEVVIPGTTLVTRPVTRPGEILEAVPGLIVTQHSGEGKANQYFLRGYNLDHGTDMAMYVDDMPINMRTHAHGQGYSDLNWLMPEMIGFVDMRKGPYFADEGDFGSAGALHIGLLDRLNGNLASVTIGSFGYQRAFGASSSRVGTTSVLAGVEVARYDGPWTEPDGMQKLNGLLRFSSGSQTDGSSLTALAYSNHWHSTDQVPERAITSGLIGRFDSGDPTDGGNTSHYSLSGRIAQSDADGVWKANAFVIKSELDLFNNFTYFLSDPTNGDQFHQHDNRVVAGANASRLQKGSLFEFASEITIGIQTRYDRIDLGLSDTYQRSFITPIRFDRVSEGSVGVYADNTVHWTPWFRTTTGWRGDVFNVNVNSLLDANNSGTKQAGIASPKFTAVLGPFAKTELFAGAGYGMHSNDARGVTITESPTDATTKLSPSPLLVRTRGAEVGVRTKAVPGLETSLSLFSLDQDSEIIFNGDGGDTSPSRPSLRYGVEWTNTYRPAPWLAIDADVALTHARFRGFDADQDALYASLAGYPQAQAGNAAGNYIPNAPAIVASAGITLGDKLGWFGGVRWRYLGSTPLTEDNYFRSVPTSLFNGRLGYHFDDNWTMQLDGLNLLNAKANQITYGYGSLLKTDSLYNLCFPVQVAPAAVCQNGVMDRIVHPTEPLAVRFTVSKVF